MKSRQQSERAQAKIKNGPKEGIILKQYALFISA